MHAIAYLQLMFKSAGLMSGSHEIVFFIVKDLQQQIAAWLWHLKIPSICSRSVILFTRFKVY